MQLNSLYDFRNGLAVPIRPNPSFIDELRLNGKSQQFIDHFIKTGVLKRPHNSSNLYGGAKGYNFDWGHVSEECASDIHDGEAYKWVHWNFYFDDLLAEFHKHGLRLEELCLICEGILTRPSMQNKFILSEVPPSLRLADGDEASAFELFSVAKKKEGDSENLRAREWIANYFLCKTVPELIRLVKKTLQQGMRDYE